MQVMTFAETHTYSNKTHALFNRQSNNSEWHVHGTNTGTSTSMAINSGNRRKLVTSLPEDDACRFTCQKDLEPKKILHNGWLPTHLDQYCRLQLILVSRFEGTLSIKHFERNFNKLFYSFSVLAFGEFNLFVLFELYVSFSVFIFPRSTF